MLIRRGEYWRPVAGYEGQYSVSSRGRVRSEPRIVCCAHGVARSMPGKILKAIPDGLGYTQVVLSDEFSYKRKERIHVLVLLAFVGRRPRGMHGRHKNGNGADNRRTNLVWGTRKSNEADKILHGRTNRGMRHGMARLSDSDVRDIRQRHAARNDTQRDLAREYLISQTVVSDIASGKLWKHI